jgi:predicted PurR-regulated permease PerM
MPDDLRPPPHAVDAASRERFVERILMGLLLGGIGIGCVVILRPFISSLLWAGILVFTTWPVFDALRHRLGRPMPAALIMLLLTAAVIVLPIALAVPGSATDINRLRGVIEEALRAGLPGPPDWLFTVPIVGRTLGDLWTHWAADLSVMVEALRPYFGIVIENTVSVLLGLAQGVVMAGLALFFAFFFYVSGDPIAERLRDLVHRIAGDRAERLIAITGATIRGTVYGLIGTAIVQGILTIAGLAAAGVPRAVLLGTIAGMMSVLPIGAPVVWIPAALWLANEGHLGWGIALTVWGIVAISGSDQVIRPLFIARGAHLPFVVTVLGVLGGALAFGLLGIFLGPVLLGVGFTLVTEWARPEETNTVGAASDPIP